MKPHNSILCLFISALSLSATSCGQTSSHADDVNYYVTIGLQMKDIVPKVQTFWQDVKQGIVNAKQKQDQTLDKESLDTLKTSFAKVVADLDMKIKKINALNETDEDLKLKQTVSSYLQETKQLQETAIPKILELLENGIDKINDEQTAAIKSFATKGGELQMKSKEIEDLSLQYQRKHKITNEELDKYGL